MRFQANYHDFGRYIISDEGFYLPAADLSALLKEWSYQGFKYCSGPELRKEIGCLIVVLKDPCDEQVWLEEIRKGRK